MGVLSDIAKYARIVSILEKNNVTFNGLVDGLVQTHHNENPKYKLNQNIIWWDRASEDEIVGRVITELSKNR